MTDLEFRKSSYSGNRQDCVEVARHTAIGAAMRDTKNRGLGHIEFPAAEWAAFIEAAKTHEL
ncbi:hypothetical protein HNR23_000289 [Nocardiopsis mwathae]|uniref:DUF397 domain-containing protein n=1 Tax=Nocardiopsis mwathae TaxID=1472723 RepID=A0A7W9YDQ3_9ACTN|nr:DUF397 domain-containing protein [Nocardiopsis mwathae]MBB6170229.1 hypothetical protein [Nocardiopsis mwathae]